MKIGYARISTDDQNLDLQNDALGEAGCETIWQEQSSGAKADRPQLEAMLKSLRKGDVLVVWKLDRLARSLKQLIEIVDALKARGIQFVSLQDSIDTTTPGGELIFHMFGALAQFERGIIRERTMAGLASARARGRLGGRKAKMTKKDIRVAKTMLDTGDHTPMEIARHFGVNRSTIYRSLNRLSNVMIN